MNQPDGPEARFAAFLERSELDADLLDLDAQADEYDPITAAIDNAAIDLIEDLAAVQP